MTPPPGIYRTRTLAGGSSGASRGSQTIGALTPLHLSSLVYSLVCTVCVLITIAESWTHARMCLTRMPLRCETRCIDGQGEGLRPT